MRTPHIITTSATVLATLLAVSCSKSSSEPTAQDVRQVSSLPSDMPKADLGVVELSPQTPKRVSIAGGRECVMYPIVQSDGNLRIEVAIETRTADGKTNRLGQSRLIARAGQECALSVGDTMVSLTPTLKTQ